MWGKQFIPDLFTLAFWMLTTALKWQQYVDIIFHFSLMSLFMLRIGLKRLARFKTKVNNLYTGEAEPFRFLLRTEDFIYIYKNIKFMKVGQRKNNSYKRSIE